MVGDGRGYKVPAVINPGSARCIRVYVPDDPDYLAAFWASYQYLGTWHAWERDADKRGKLAAAVWRPWTVVSRSQFDSGVECDLPDVDPLYPETDGIDEVDDALWYWKTIIEDVVAYLDDESPYTLEIVSSSVLVDAGIDIGSALAGLIDYLTPLTPVERAAAVGSIDWHDMRDKIFCGLPAKYDDTKHWLDLLSDAIFAWLTDASGFIYDALQTFVNYVNGIFGGSYLSAFAAADPGGGGGFAFGDPACEFEHEFDFTVSPCGFLVDYITDYNAGSWVPGTGFVTGIKHTASYHRSVSLMYPFFPTRNITRWEFDVTITKGHFDSPSSTYGYYSVLYYNGSARSGYLIVTVAGNMVDGVQTIGSNHTQDCNGIYFRGLAAQGNLESEVQDGEFIITAARVMGHGTDPFV